MLGIVFTEFCEMVETVHSAELLDDVLTDSEKSLQSRGSYTSVGNYDHEEMLVLVGTLARMTDTPVPALIQSYGRYLFGRFVVSYPVFFQNLETSLDFLQRVEHHIHHEVKKLYPAAQLPTFDCARRSEHELTMLYQSDRPFALLALGLIEGCADHFGENLHIDYKDLSNGQMTRARFELRLERTS